MAEEGGLPLRVTGAALRSVVSGRHAHHYGRVVDFVDAVWQQASSLITYQHYLKLTLAFKAKLVMEMFVRQCSLLDILQTLDKYFPPQSSADPQASRMEVVKEQQCRLQFRRLVLRLVRDGAYRHHFLQGDVEQEFGALFMAAAQALLWEFLERIETILPPLRIEQPRAGSMDTGSLSVDKQLLADCSRTLPDRLLHPPRQRQRQRSRSTGSGSEPEPGPEGGVAPPGAWMMGSGEMRLARSSPGGGGGEGRPGSPRSLVFSAFHLDQWSDEEPGRCPPLPRPPPDPLQSQRAESLPAAAAVCDQRGRSGARRVGTSRGPGAAGRGSGSLGGLTHLGLNLQRLSSAPVPREVGEQLASCPQFQPKVLLVRLSGGQRAQGDTAPTGRDRQRGPTAVRRWGLRLKDGGGQASMGTESEDSALWGETPLSDPSDHDYYPFCSQDTAHVRWLRRNSLGQFTTRYHHVDGNPD